MEYLPSGFIDVDNSEDYSKYANCLNLLNTLEFFKKYKNESHQLLELHNGLNVLDVGCGVGDDLIDMAEVVGPSGVVTGLDSSEILLKIAGEKIKNSNGNIKLVKGNALSLELDDQTFDRCKIDRTLQHISDPKKALIEMYRVLKPGGIMLAFDNDWETFMFSCGKKELVREVANYWCDSFASGWVGRYLYTFFKELGLKNIKVYPKTLVITDLEKSDEVFDLFQTIEHCMKKHIISDSEAKDLLDEMKEQDKSDRFFSSYTGFIAIGKKPAR